MNVDSRKLLGRDAEVRSAVEVVAGADGGRVAVVGPAGIGKSAVVDAVAEQAARAGLTVRRSTGAVSETGLPFVALNDVLGVDVRAGLSRLPVTLREALEAALHRSRPGESGTDPAAVNLAALEVLEHLTATGRVLLVLDDVQWIDGASQAVLSFVMRRLAPDRLSLLVAMRPEAAGVSIAPAEPKVIRLGPLPPETLRAVVEKHTGGTLPYPLQHRLHALSGGNPLLALELVRTATLDRPRLAEVAVPDRYRAILAPRLDALSTGGRRVVLAAALLSRPSVEELAEVGSVEDLLEAEAAGVLEVAGGAVGFTHPLFAELCRNTAGAGQRRAVHAALAGAAHDELERARHLGAATVLPDEGVASSLQSAAEAARARAATAAAAELYQLAARLTPSADAERKAQRTCEASVLFEQAGDVATAEALLRGLLPGLEPGPTRARCLLRLGDVIGEDSRAGVALVGEALREPALDPDFEAEARLTRAAFLINLGDLEGAGATAVEVEASARASGQDNLARSCRYLAAFAEIGSGERTDRSPVWQRLMADTSPAEPDYYDATEMQAYEAMWRDDMECALALLNRRMNGARAAGMLGLWGETAMHYGEAQLRRGNIALACDILDDACRVLAAGRHDEACLSFRALALAWAGRLDEARSDGSQALAMAEQDGNRLFVANAHHALGFLDLSAGDVVGAADHYAALAEALDQMGWRHPGLVVWQGNAVEAMVAAGRPADAARITDALEAYADKLGLTNGKALALRCRGLLNADAGDLAGAETALDDSVRLVEQLPTPLEQARTLLARGIVRRRLRQKAASARDLESARDIFARRGARVWAAHAEAELERSAAAYAGSKLSSSERAVAELAAAGATNREIATKLFLSEKTVEAVLTRVYRKLAVRSRTQLSNHPDLHPS